MQRSVQPKLLKKKHCLLFGLMYRIANIVVTFIEYQFDELWW